MGHCSCTAFIRQRDTNKLLRRKQNPSQPNPQQAMPDKKGDGEESSSPVRNGDNVGKKPTSNRSRPGKEEPATKDVKAVVAATGRFNSLAVVSEAAIARAVEVLEIIDEYDLAELLRSVADKGHIRAPPADGVLENIFGANYFEGTVTEENLRIIITQDIADASHPENLPTLVHEAVEAQARLEDKSSAEAHGKAEEVEKLAKNAMQIPYGRTYKNRWDLRHHNRPAYSRAAKLIKKDRRGSVVIDQLNKWGTAVFITEDGHKQNFKVRIRNLIYPAGGYREEASWDPPDEELSENRVLTWKSYDSEIYDGKEIKIYIPVEVDRITIFIRDSHDIENLKESVEGLAEFLDPRAINHFRVLFFC